MRIVFLISISITIAISSYAQHRGDYNWIFGYDFTDSLPGTEGSLIDFNNKPPTVKYQSVLPENEALGNSVSLMSHPNTGKLLFYSNGCNVFDASHRPMVNGNGINPGLYRDYYCESTEINWYPILGTLLSMEDTYHPDKYYFLHTPRQWPELGNPYCDRLMYSYIDMTKNAGLGEVVKKNEIYYQDPEEVHCAYTAVIKHENQKDWWVIHPILESNKFLTFLIDSLGPRLIRTQQIGDVIERRGASKFSSDGKTLGLFNGFDGYYQYNFDRESGLLSTPKRLNLHFSGTGGGLAYSASSDFVYLSYRDRIYQVETDQDDLEDGAVLVDTLILFGDGQSSSFSQAQLGPDCKIYITHLGGVGYLGVINNPDEKGINCNLEQRGLDLAYFHDIGSIPNFPPFRVDEEDKCDNTISSLFPTVMRPKQTYFDYYPNPVEDVLKVLPKVDGRYTITDASGSLIRKGTFDSDVEEVVNLDQLISGVYFINIIVDGVIIQSEKLVKI
jgi:hypothetical protein